MLDQNGINRNGTIGFNGVPPVGEISQVLLNLLLRDTFDRLFPKIFPGIIFMRFYNELYLFTNTNDQLNEKDLYRLMDELSLFGKIESIGPGDKPLMCYYHKLLS